MEFYITILSGGSGYRFWPISRRQYPKQFLSLTGKRSLLQQTVFRITPLIEYKQLLIITGSEYTQLIAEQLPQIPTKHILAEPITKNTTAAIGLSALWVAQRNPTAVCLILPADHLIIDENLYLDTLQRAIQLASKEDVLVSLGITPYYAATGFGYIEIGKTLDKQPPKINLVKSFHEKPNLTTAKNYFKSGRYLWNSGIFAWRAEILLEEIAKYLPDFYNNLQKLRTHLGTQNQKAVMAEIYPHLPAISIDHSLMEKSTRQRVIKAEFGWSDIGSWEVIKELWPHDHMGNSSPQGKMIAIEAKDNIISAGNRLIALFGINMLVAVVTDDILLILPKNRCQEIYKIIETLKKDGYHEYL